VAGPHQDRFQKTSGTGCCSSDGKALTVSLSSVNPSFLGAGQLGADYIQLNRGDSQEPFTGEDLAAFAGSRADELHEQSGESPVVARLTRSGLVLSEKMKREYSGQHV
jgi:hypothetical protein